MKLTPLGKKALKVMVAVTVLLVAATAIWYVLKNRGGDEETAAEAKDDGGGGILGIFGGGSKSGPLGSEDNPLTVSIVSWHGYVGGLLANGGLETQEGSIYQEDGLYVKFLLEDDIPTISSRFETDTAQCIWRTVDFWAQEQPGLRGVELDGRMVMIVDNSRGGDAIIGGPGVKSIEDLAGKQVATTEFTPSHMLAIYAINQSAMSKRQRESVQLRPFATNADALAAFKGGKVDALVTWEPETSLALLESGSHRVFDTSQATALIYDGMVCNTNTIENNPEVIQKFVSGWLEGAEKARANPAKGAQVLVDSEPMFAELVRDQGMGFLTDKVFEGILWTTLEDNIRILGLAGGTNQFERVYTESDDIWRANTNLLEGMPRVNVRDGFDDRFVRALMDVNPTARQQASLPEFEFSESERGEKVAKEEAPSLTKPVEINFATGKSDLSQRGKQTVDTELVPLLDATGGAYVKISGNTDSTGSRATNMRLSKDRADTVAKYLIDEWEIPSARLEVAGNGPDDPLCDESDPTGSGYDDLESCRAANRTTRVSIL